MYRLSKDEHNKLKKNAITSTYKKASIQFKNKVEKMGGKFAKDKGIMERIQRNGEKECFISLKDHKDNFQNHPTTRLLNPLTMSEVIAMRFKF